MAERKLRAVSGKPRTRAPDLRECVADSVGAMTWLEESDSAIKALALRLADEIEGAIDRAEEFTALRGDLAGDISAYKRLMKLEAMCDATKSVGWLGPQLQGVLRDLGGTPASRAAMKKDKPIGGRLAQLRAEASGQRDPGVDDS